MDELTDLLVRHNIDLIAPGDGSQYLQDANLWTALGRVETPIDGPDDPDPLVQQVVGRGATPLAACQAWVAEAELRKAEA